MNDVSSYGYQNQPNFGAIKKHEDEQDLLTNQFVPKHAKGLGEEDSTLISLGGQGQTPVKGQYPALINRPMIPNPVEKDQVPFDKEQVTQQTMQKLMGYKNQLPNNSAISSAFEEQLSTYAQQNNLSQEEVVKLRYAFYNPDATEDPKTKAEAQKVANSASQELQQKYNLPSNYQITPNSQGFNDSVATAYSSAFEGQLAQLAKQLNLTPDQVNQLRYAFYNPGTASPDIQQMLTQLETGAAQIVQQQFGLPTGWKPSPPDNTEFNANIEAAFDKGFENTLQNQIPPLTESQKGQLRFMFYNPQTTFPGSAELEQMLHEMELNTLNAFKGTLGLPQGVQPQPATQYFNSVLSSAYQVALKEVLAEYLDTLKPPMNNKDKALLERALEDPDDPSLPDEIKQIAAMLQGKAITAVKQRYNLPEVWSPSLNMQQIPNNPATNLVTNGVNYLNDTVKTGFSVILNLPPSPSKMALIDFLKIINDALNKLKELLYTMTTMDSEVAKKITQAKLADQQEKLKFFQEAQYKAEHSDSGGGKGGGKSQSSQKFLDIFMKIITPIMMVVTFVIMAVLTICTGGAFAIAGIAIMLALTALMVADSQTHCISKFFEFVSSVVNDMMPDWVPDTLKDITQIMIKIAIIVLICLMCCVNMNVVMSVGLSFGMQAIMDSNVVQQGIGACGGNQQAQEIAAMVVGCALAVLVGIVGLFAGMGGGEGGEVAEVGEESIEETEEGIEMAKVGLQLAESMSKDGEEEGEEGASLTGSLGEASADEISTDVKTSTQTTQEFTNNMKQIFNELISVNKTAIKFIEGITKNVNKAAIKFTEEITKNVNKTAIKFTEGIAKNAKSQFKFLEKQAKWAKDGIDKFAKFAKIIKENSVKYEGWGKAGMDDFGRVELALNVTAQSIQISQAIQAMKQHMELAALAMLEANLEAAIIQLEALIKQLQHVIDVLLDGLSNTVGWIKDINQMQNQIWQGASSSMTHLVHSTSSAA